MRAWIGIAALVLAAGAAPGRAEAQDVRPGGALGGHFLIADGDLGGAAILDVWAVLEDARLGGFVGGGATPSDRDDHNRVMMPFGVSFALDVVSTESLLLEVRARAGLWGGATQAEKLTIGIFLGGGAYLGFLVGRGAAITVGADVWAVIGSDAWRARTGPDDAISASTWVIAPGLGFTWTPESEDAEPREEEP